MPTDIDADNTEPATWDTTPLTMKAWFRQLPKLLVRKNPAYRTWWERGYVISKDRIYAPSPRHASALQRKDVLLHTFRECISSEILREDSDTSDSEEDAAGGDASPALNKRYNVSHEVCAEIDRLLAEAIVSTITIESAQDSWLARSGSSALALIPLLVKALDNIGDSANGLIAQRLIAHTIAGPASDRVSSFNQWKGRFDVLNESQSDADVHTGAKLAASYVNGIRSLGGDVSKNILLELRLRRATGDPVKCVEAINASLAEHEADVERLSLSGAGLSASGAALAAGTDPSRTKLGNFVPGTPSFDKNKPPPSECTTCRKELNRSEMHWNSKCPRPVCLQNELEPARNTHP